MAEKRARLIKAVEEALPKDQRSLLQLMSFENRKDGITVRMPLGVVSMEPIWQTVQAVAATLTLQVYKADTFATLDELEGILSEIEWLWKGWIPKGFVSMLVGDPGVGKSMVALDFGRIVTTGSQWPLSKERARKTMIAWLDTEASQQLLLLRAKNLGIERKHIAIPSLEGDMLTQINMGEQTHREHIINMVEAHKPSLLVLDSLSGANMRGENKVEDIKPIMQFFALLARDYDLAVLAIHHLNKSNISESPEVTLYRIRGSMAIPQFARSILSLESVKEGIIKMRMIKSNLARMGNPITVTPLADEDGDIHGFTYAPFTPPPPKKNKGELVAEWVMSKLSKSKVEDGYPLAKLVEQGKAEGFTRGNIYTAKAILGERIAVSGTGNAAFWHIADFNDEDAIRAIGGKIGND